MFSDNLRRLRKANKMTQEQLAKIINVERSSVGKYESSNIIPSADVLCKIAEYFDVSIDYLLGRKDEKENAAESKVTEDDIKFALFNGDKEITNEMYDEVKRFAQFVKERNKDGNKNDL